MKLISPAFDTGFWITIPQQMEKSVVEQWLVTNSVCLWRISALKCDTKLIKPMIK